MFSMTFKLGYEDTVFIFLSLFLVLLGIKLVLKRYAPLFYWLVFTASAIAGTGISDFIDRTLHLGYTTGSLILISMLLLVLAVWYIKEKSISVERITTQSSEVFYWIAFLIANTLGTAAGDFISTNLGLGFLHGAILITALLILTALLHYFTKVSGILLFWIAFVLTRPFGATFGDLLTKPHKAGGLGIGTIGASAFFILIFAIALIKEIGIQKRLSIEEV